MLPGAQECIINVFGRNINSLSVMKKKIKRVPAESSLMVAQCFMQRCCGRAKYLYGDLVLLSRRTLSGWSPQDEGACSVYTVAADHSVSETKDFSVSCLR